MTESNARALLDAADKRVEAEEMPDIVRDIARTECNLSLCRLGEKEAIALAAYEAGRLAGRRESSDILISDIEEQIDRHELTLSERSFLDVMIQWVPELLGVQEEE